jgi:predicted transcriptional regulator
MWINMPLRLFRLVKKIKKDKIKDHMIKKPTVSPNSDINEAILPIISKELDSVVVIKDKKPVGIVTITDILDVFQTSYAETQHPSELLKLVGKTVEDFMTKNPVTVNENLNLEDAIRILESFKLRRLIVVDDSLNYVGVLSFRKILADALSI